MTYTIYKLENTKARLCAGYTQTNDKMILDMTVKAWESAGFITNVTVEG